MTNLKLPCAGCGRMVTLRLTSESSGDIIHPLPLCELHTSILGQKFTLTAIVEEEAANDASQAN